MGGEGGEVVGVGECMGATSLYKVYVVVYLYQAPGLFKDMKN